MICWIVLENISEVFTASGQHKLVSWDLLIIIADQCYIVKIVFVSQRGKCLWGIAGEIIPLQTKLFHPHRWLSTDPGLHLRFMSMKTNTQPVHIPLIPWDIKCMQALKRINIEQVFLDARNSFFIFFLEKLDWLMNDSVCCVSRCGQYFHPG